MSCLPKCARASSAEVCASSHVEHLGRPSSVAAPKCVCPPATLSVHICIHTCTTRRVRRSVELRCLVCSAPVLRSCRASASDGVRALGLCLRVLSMAWTAQRCGCHTWLLIGSISAPHPSRPRAHTGRASVTIVMACVRRWLRPDKWRSVCGHVPIWRPRSAPCFCPLPTHCLPPASTVFVGSISATVRVCPGPPLAYTTATRSACTVPVFPTTRPRPR